MGSVRVSPAIVDGDEKQLGAGREEPNYARAEDQLEIHLEMGWNLTANATKQLMLSESQPWLGLQSQTAQTGAPLFHRMAV